MAEKEIATIDEVGDSISEYLNKADLRFRISIDDDIPEAIKKRSNMKRALVVYLPVQYGNLCIRFLLFDWLKGFGFNRFMRNDEFFIAVTQSKYDFSSYDEIELMMGDVPSTMLYFPHADYEWDKDNGDGK